MKQGALTLLLSTVTVLLTLLQSCQAASQSCVPAPVPGPQMKADYILERPKRAGMAPQWSTARTFSRIRKSSFAGMDLFVTVNWLNQVQSNAIDFITLSNTNPTFEPAKGEVSLIYVLKWAQGASDGYWLSNKEDCVIQTINRRDDMLLLVEVYRVPSKVHSPTGTCARAPEPTIGKSYLNTLLPSRSIPTGDGISQTFAIANSRYHGMRLTAVAHHSSTGYTISFANSNPTSPLPKVPTRLQYIIKFKRSGLLFHFGLYNQGECQAIFDSSYAGDEIERVDVVGPS